MGKRYALCVGVNNGLKYAQTDAEKMYDLFYKQLNFITVKKLIGDAATIKNIEREINAFKEKTQPGDLFIFYYSGHATKVKLDPSNEDTHEAILLNQPELLPDEIINAYWYDFALGVDILVVMDTCYAEGFYDKNQLQLLNIQPKFRELKETDPQVAFFRERYYDILTSNKSNELQPPANFFFACGKDHSAFEGIIEDENSSISGGYGYFTYAFLKHAILGKYQDYYEMFQLKIRKETIDVKAMGQTPEWDPMPNGFEDKVPFS